MKRLVWGVAVVLAVSSVTIRANDDKKSSSALTTAITKAADSLLARQRTFNNGGLQSDETPIGGILACSWEWEAGSGWAYPNTQSPTARGLLAAYAVTEKSKYLAGAVCAANRLVAYLDANPTERPYSEDVIFLTEVSEASGNRTYATRAALYHKRTRTKFATGALLTDYYISKRLSLASWDLASQIDAAVAVDQEDYARAIAEQLIDRRASWEGVLFYNGWDYTTIGRAALLSSLKPFEGKTIRKYRDEAIKSTLAAQAANGSWDSDDYQATGFGIAGLSTVPSSASVSAARTKGIAYLLTTQSTGGGWIYPAWAGYPATEYPEIDGEVLSALCRFAKDHGEDDRDQ